MDPFQKNQHFTLSKSHVTQRTQHISIYRHGQHKYWPLETNSQFYIHHPSTKRRCSPVSTHWTHTQHRPYYPTTTHQAANSSNPIRLGVCVAVSAKMAALVHTAPSSTARVSSSADRLELAKLSAMRAVRKDLV